MKTEYENVKQVADFVSVTTVLATLTAWLPPMAALVSIIWGLIRIYETPTVQRWVTRRREQRCDCGKGQVQ